MKMIFQSILSRDGQIRFSTIDLDRAVETL